VVIDFAELLKPMTCCPHLVLVLGKGGVGKTTVSIMIARSLSKLDKTLLLSLDPARHLVKYLSVGGEGPVEVSKNLHVHQVSVEREISEITSKYSELLRELAPSLLVYNLDNVVDAVKYSPGVEEEVFLRVLLRACRGDYRYVVVDTPPTGVALRTLVLPALYTAWLERLIEIRERIVSLRYVIARAMGRKVELKDRALERLYELRGEFKYLQDMLTCREKTSYVIVATPEPLPLYELKESYSFLESRVRNKPKLLVLNKLLPDHLARELGVLEAQRRSLEEVASYGARYVVIEYLGRPTESLRDIEELEKRVKVF
jgi:arsenite-transporting ATPase